MSLTRVAGGLCLTCGDCGATSPPKSKGRLARAAAKSKGWVRLYHGTGELFRCPDCRSDRKLDKPRRITAPVTLVSYEAWHELADTEGTTVSALIQVIGLNLRACLPDEVIDEARKVAAVRRRQHAGDGQAIAEGAVIDECDCRNRPANALNRGPHHAPGCRRYEP